MKYLPLAFLLHRTILIVNADNAGRTWGADLLTFDQYGHTQLLSGVDLCTAARMEFDH